MVMMKFYRRKTSRILVLQKFLSTVCFAQCHRRERNELGNSCQFSNPVNSPSNLGFENTVYSLVEKLRMAVEKKVSRKEPLIEPRFRYRVGLRTESRFLA